MNSLKKGEGGPTFKLWRESWDPTFKFWRESWGSTVKLWGVPGPTFKFWGGSQGPGVLVPLLHHATTEYTITMFYLFYLNP